MRLPHIRWRSVAAFLGSTAGVALVHAVAGEKAAAVVGLATGLVLAQSQPAVESPRAAPAADGLTDGARVQAAIQGGADATAHTEDGP